MAEVLKTRRVHFILSPAAGVRCSRWQAFKVIWLPGRDWMRELPSPRASGALNAQIPNIIANLESVIANLESVAMAEVLKTRRVHFLSQPGSRGQVLKMASIQGGLPPPRASGAPNRADSKHHRQPGIRGNGGSPEDQACSFYSQPGSRGQALKMASVQGGSFRLGPPAL